MTGGKPVGDDVTGSRRQLALACGMAGLGALAMLVSAGRPWAHAVIHQPPPLPQQRVAVSGGDLAGVVRALALLGSAGIAALLALRGWWRVALGAVLVAAGVGAVLALGLAAPTHVRDAGEIKTRLDTGASVTVSGRTVWPLLYAAGGVAVAASGALAIGRGRDWPGMGTRYDAPARRTPARDTDPWRALDHGEDPTLR